MQQQDSAARDNQKPIKKDLYEAPDYFLVDDLLTEEHKLIRDTVRTWVKKEVSPIIEDFAQRAEQSYETQVLVSKIK